MCRQFLATYADSSSDSIDLWVEFPVLLANANLLSSPTAQVFHSLATTEDVAAATIAPILFGLTHTNQIYRSSATAENIVCYTGSVRTRARC